MPATSSTSATTTAMRAVREKACSTFGSRQRGHSTATMRHPLLYCAQQRRTQSLKATPRPGAHVVGRSGRGASGRTPRSVARAARPLTMRTSSAASRCSPARAPKARSSTPSRRPDGCPLGRACTRRPSCTVERTGCLETRRCDTDIHPRGGSSGAPHERPEIRLQSAPFSSTSLPTPHCRTREEDGAWEGEKLESRLCS